MTASSFLRAAALINTMESSKSVFIWYSVILMTQVARARCDKHQPKHHKTSAKHRAPETMSQLNEQLKVKTERISSIVLTIHSLFAATSLL